MPIWTYFQIRSYVNSASRRDHFSRPMTDLETICSQGEQLQKATSITYKWLQSHTPERTDRFRKHWSAALNRTFTDKQWTKACILAHKCSISTKMQETSYKLLTDWYVTPAKLHFWYARTPKTCWRCGGDTGTLLHIWWQCPKLTTYWCKVRDLIKSITETKLKLDAACCLLHISSQPLKKYKTSLTKHMLNAAKTLIPLSGGPRRYPLSHNG